MPWGVRLTVLSGNTRTQHDYARLPVRIGRNALNDLRLAGGAVSQFHALLELHPGQILAIHDLGSKNGTAVPGLGRLHPNQTVAITDAANEFYVAQYFIQAELVDLSSESLDFNAAGRMKSPATPREFNVRAILQDRTVVGVTPASAESGEDHTVMVGPNVRPRTAQLPRLDDDEPLSVRTIPHSSTLAMRFKPLYDDYRESWGRLFEGIQGTVGSLDAELAEEACGELARTFPGLMSEAEFRTLRDPIPVDEAPIATQQQPPENAVRATVAYNGLQQLAAVYHPTDHALATPEDVAHFLEKLFEVLDSFFRCFIPLRDGYRAFTTQMDLSVNTRSEGMPIMGSAATVDSAATTSDLGAALLDWKKPLDPNRPQPSQLVEWVFADLMIHHMAMITGVMQGVKKLLGELSPAMIERALDDPKRAQGGLQIGPFRYKQLWEMYATRHSDLTDEDKETFAVIFGADFARAYSQLAADTQATAASRMSSSFPTRTPSVAQMPPTSRKR